MSNYAIGCWLCSSSGEVSEAHKTPEGYISNCHESCYQKADEEVQRAIDGLNDRQFWNNNGVIEDV